MPRIVGLEERILLDASSSADFAGALCPALLARTGQPAAIAWWADRMQEGAGALEVASGFLTSPEYRTRVVARAAPRFTRLRTRRCTATTKAPTP